MKRKKFSLLDEYRKSWTYICKSRKFIYAVIAVFLFFAVLGFFIVPPEVISNQILAVLQKILEETEGLSMMQMILYIFFNNLQSSFLGIILGIFFGIFPILSSLLNGYILGFVASKSVEEAGTLILLRLFPHGIFELPAVFIALGMGLKLGSFVFKKNYKSTFKNYLENSIRVFLTIVLPLLILAAIIEGILVFVFQ